MASLRVEIVRWADDSFPGWVECKFIDANDLAHIFIEKVPVVTNKHLEPASTYPQIGSIACEVVAKGQGGYYEVDTSRPSGIESTTGATHFVAHASQFLEF